MKNTKKTLLVIVAMILMCAMSAAVTLALYTAQTENMTNTFTFGNVDIIVDEVDNDDPTVRIQDGNSYDVDPGFTYAKDPIVHNEGSEKAWARVAVALNKNVHDEFAQFYADDPATLTKLDVLKNFVVDEDGNTTLDEQNWTYVGYYDDDEGNYVYLFDYNTALDAKNDTNSDQTTAIFTKFSIPRAWDPSKNAATSKLTANEDTTFITITAYAVQADYDQNAEETVAGATEIFDEVFDFEDDFEEKKYTPASEDVVPNP